MTTSIFIRSFPGDFEWLTWCLRSVHRFAQDFDEVVVAIPEGSELSLTKEKIVYVKAGKDDYLTQQVHKAQADFYCEGDYIVNLDSDSHLIKPVTPQDFMVDGKPLWLMTPFEHVLSNDPNTHAWKRAMKLFNGVEPSFEMMRRIGQCIPRWAYGCFRDFCQRRHGKTFEQYVLDQTNREVSEFNFIGQYLLLNFPNFIHFHDTTYSLPELLVKQNWSRGGLTDEIRAEMEEILK